MNRFEQPSELHQELNPVLWQDNELKRPVQIALLRIAKAYWKFLGIDTRLDDVLVTGSQANFNYSEHSDIDLHLVVDYNDVECDMAVDELFKTKRDLWKAEHDIDIHSIPVEVYVEDLNRPAVSATYSIVKNAWIKQPKRVPISSDVDRIERLCLAWMILITTRLATNELDQIEQVKDMLWTYRKKGLAVEGEMGVPKLVFKTLRNSGVTEMLLKAVSTLRDRDLSLENQPNS
jgi:hypothetical protein